MSGIFPITGNSAPTGLYDHTIDQSLRFEDGDSAYLTRTFGSAGNQRTWTWSAWIKRGNLGGSVIRLFNANDAGSPFRQTSLRFDSDQLRFFNDAPSGVTTDVKSSAVFRDPSAWYNIVLAIDTTSGTASNRVKMYVNGSQITDLATSTYPTQNLDMYVNAARSHQIGASVSPSQHFDGYMAEVNFIDGSQLDPTSFGETKAGIWIPKEYTGSYGTNGFHLTFAEAGDLGADSAYTTHDIFGDSSAVATYLFDGSIVDAGGNYDGTTTSVTFTDGIVGTQAGVFDGSSSKWVAGTHLLGAHATASDISVSGWFQVSSTFQYLITDGFAGTGGGYFAVYPETNGYLQVATGHASNGNNITVTGSEVVTDGEWHHFVFTKSVSSGTATGKLWVDGNYAGSDTTTDSTAYSNETAFGHFAYANTFYACTLDQIRIFNRALTDAEVQELAGGYGLDASGVGNHFNPANLQSTDVVLDSPTNNWCTINSVGSLGTQSEGNLKTVTTSSGYGSVVGSMGQTSGKWYWEVIPVSNVSGAPLIGVVDETYDAMSSASAVGYLLSGGKDSIAYYNNGSSYINGTPNSSYGASYTGDDIIGVALNLDGNEITFYKNGVSQGAISHTFSGGNILPAVSDGTNSASQTFAFNFGQDSSFAGTKTAQGNTDANGKGDFYYTPPSGFLALCSANLPDLDIDPAQAEEPADYFNTILYTGNGVSATDTQAISGVGFSPDFTWIKNRTSGAFHILNDRVRGAGKNVFINSTFVENSGGASTGDLFTSFDSDGFTVNYQFAGSTNSGTNQNTDAYVAWNWLAGGSAVNNTTGTIQSSVSANTKAGFSIVNWTGDGSTSNGVGHGLGAKPDLAIYKRRTVSTSDWYAIFDVLDGSFDRLKPNDTSVLANATGYGTMLDTDTISNFSWPSGASMLAYCFRSIDGYSKVGIYTGNGSTDGTFVYTGFRPAWVMLKNTDGTYDWVIFDAKRSTFNLIDDFFVTNDSANEYTASTTVSLDFTSNGFKIRQNWAGMNNSGNKIFYIAFAEQPFKYSNAR
tara:strand:- start:75 stop:3182 length:3108 start_codon:yes stop_codon:yes gene_type:complete